MKILSHYSLNYFLCPIINLPSFCNSNYIFLVFPIHMSDALFLLFKRFLRLIWKFSSDLYSNSLILASILSGLLMASTYASFLMSVRVYLTFYTFIL